MWIKHINVKLFYSEDVFEFDDDSVEGDPFGTNPFAEPEIHDSELEAISVQGDRQITQLPEDLPLKLLKIEVYDAGSCSIKQISKSNFENLSELRRLWLGYNQIEEIADDTFEDLTSLEYLALGMYFKCFNGSLITA